MSIKKQAVSGVKWTTISTISLALTELLKIAILARYLDKTDFGLMALVSFILGLTNLFGDMGLTTAILHKQNISKREYSSLYWLNLVFSSFLFVIVYLAAPYISSFYNEPKLSELIPLMGLTIIFSAIGRQFKVIEQKKLNFKYISVVVIISSLVSFVSSVVLAYYDFGVYSLVYSVILLQVISNSVFLIKGINDVGLLFYFKFSDTKQFLKIGIYQVGGQILNYFNRDIDVLIIGKLFGTELLGGYSLAKQLVSRPAQIINPILTKVGAPVLAKFQDNINQLKSNYLLLISIISSINFIIYFVTIVFAKYIVLIVYGSSFIEIVFFIQILSAYMYFRSLGNPVGSLVIATGRTDLEFYWNMITFIITPIIVLIASSYSIEYVAIAITINAFLMIIPAWYVLIRPMINASLKDYLRSMLPNIYKLLSLISK